MAEAKKEQVIKKSNRVHHRYKQFEFDRLQMYFGKPYVIDVEGCEGVITMKMPTIGDIMEFGEKRFYSNLNIFITNTSVYKVMLWDDMKIDWNDISDFDLFIMLQKQGIDQEACDLMFENLDWSKFEIYTKQLPPEKEGDEPKAVPILYNKEDNIEINEEVYQYIHQYLQNVFSMAPEEKNAKDPILKKWWIDSARREMNRESEKKDGNDSTSMQTTISACINHPGFKYNLNDLKKVGVCQFYDSVKRLQVYESTTALLKGMYSGMISGKDVDADAYNFMKEI